jgi:tetratricopeptide (TPR) repeat protein
MSCAKLNLQRALALNDSFMPAFNQLALYYLNQARGTGPAQGGLVVAGAKKKRANKQRLDLAALVSSQAQKKNANYAPIHNTTGLILVEMEKYNGAVKSFAAARRLNPKLFEAQMNYAAVNLSFRGFKESEEAYRAAIKLRPDTYEAHLGLALALRGQIDFQNAKELVAEAQKELNEAKKLEPKRAEAFYNEAILTEEFRAKRAGEGLEQIPAYQAQLKVYDEAVAQYEGFVQRASGDSNFKEAVEVSKSRIQDIKDTQEFVRESIQFAKDDAKMQAEEKARKAAEAKAAAEAPPAAPADVPAAPAAAAPAP